MTDPRMAYPAWSMARSIAAICTILLMGLVGTRAVDAQVVVPQVAVPLVAESPVIDSQIAASSLRTTELHDVSPVRHSFTRYTRPGQCAAARVWHERQFWRDQRPDTITYPRTGLPEQRHTVAAVRACVSRFSVATTARRDLLGLGQAYLAAEQETDADAAFATLSRVTANDSVQKHAWTLYQIISSYVDAAQPAFAKANAYLQQLDALGSPAAVERILAHDTLAKLARARDSVPMWEDELHAALTAAAALTGERQKEYASASPTFYAGLAELKERQGDFAGMAALLTTMGDKIRGIPSDGSPPPMPADYVGLLGKPAPPVQATLWANSGPAGPVRPIPGKPTLLVFTTPNCGDNCYVQHAIVRRLAAKYGPRGLNITYIVSTSGYYRNQLVTPDTEMVKITAYYLTDLKLPVTVAVWNTVFTGTRDDGRVLAQPAPNAVAYGGDGTFLIDDKGKVRLILALTRETEAIYEDVIASLW